MANLDIEKIRRIALETATKITTEKLGTAPPPVQAAKTGIGSEVKRARKVANNEAVEDLIKVAEKNREAGLDASASEPRITLIDVPNSIAGLVIGKKGCGAKHFEEHYGVYLHCRHTEMNEETQMIPFALVGGTEEAQRQVAEAIKETIEKRTKDFSQASENVEIPERFVGFVVGSKGAFLKAVQEKTGTKASLNQDVTENESKILVVRGPDREAVAGARYIVERQILEAYRRAKIFNAPLESQFEKDPRCIADLLGAPWPYTSAQLPSPPVVVPPPSLEEAPKAMLSELDVLPHGPCGPQNQLGFGRFADSDHMVIGRVNPMEVDAVEGSESYYQAVLQWAVYYAREPTCVEYYASLRSHAAQAFCCEEVAGQFGGA
mmetsp:Transcript_123778/g.194145  ORF Transcript_123778/g.194145 Transcript_123778/m.194145 type:complete len:378 (+) Transcript_123778:58-1191(+)|eukprot:CAMPEP_0169076292 /NCGR_PEP_ID=MMETSP1015-20121227/8270_1 /TAXON_ID=342587 /ORGANISM="Karlodinium micrum, Strain CCMP2283" /LENGTH=377 /DNA_ID=CAMNT_0009135745 /DNA_START=52 /DNA_END=1185 /DNA_ORIENTATION=-